MKTKLFTLCVAATLTCSMSFAKVWRVNNNVGVTADFTTAQAANDAPGVSSGDTIHIEPSTVSYGSLICSKRLTWISTGAFLNVHPNEQFSSNVGRITGIAANSAGAANSVFHVYVEGGFTINASGTKLERCYIGNRVTIQSGLDIVIINCYGKEGLIMSQGNNIIVTNNIFESLLSVGSQVNLAVITHNVFNAVVGSAGVINNSIVENNIFNKAGSPYTATNSTIQNNMAGGANVLPAGNNNQNGVDMSTVFVNNNGNDDASFVLKAGSPAIGAGSGTPAVDLGAYGGSLPFKKALQPAIPAIYKIQAPAAAAGNTLNVTFSTKSNN